MRSASHAFARLIGLACALAAGMAAAATQDAAAVRIKAGEAIYARCLACHALAYDRTGPRHCGLFGRKAGSVQGVDYSQAMRQSNIVWDQKTLDRFLENPVKAVPGTSMGYAGIASPTERQALIAYLRQANESFECKK